MSTDEEVPCDVSMESIIIQQNHDFLAVQEELEEKSREVGELHFLLAERDCRLAELESLVRQREAEALALREGLSRTSPELQETKALLNETSSREKQLEGELIDIVENIKLISEENINLKRSLEEAIKKNEEIASCQKTIETYEKDTEFLANALSSFLVVLSTAHSSQCNISESDLNNINQAIHQVVSPKFNDVSIIMSKCLTEITSLCNNFKKMSELTETQRKELSLKSEELRKTLVDLEFLKSKCLSSENEKSLIQNKIKYLEQENSAFETNIEALKSNLSEMKEQVKKYEEEKVALNNEIEKLKIETVKSKGLNNLWVGQAQIPTSTPLVRQPFSEFDLEEDDPPPDHLAQGDGRNMELSPIATVEGNFTGSCQAPAQHSQTSHQVHMSLLKWIDKCTELDEENRLLQLKINDLEMYNQDMKSTIESVKEEMKVFEEKQIGLEEKLGMYISLKKHSDNLEKDIDIKNVVIEQLRNELEEVEEERNEIRNKYFEAEEKIKNLSTQLINENEKTVVDPVIKIFNENVKELISYKQKYSKIEKERNKLVFKVRLLSESNSSYVEKMKCVCEQMYSLEEDVEKVNRERLETLYRERLLRRECEALRLRLGYMERNVRGEERRGLTDEIQRELVGMLRLAGEGVVPSEGDGGSLARLVEEMRQEVQGEVRDLSRAIRQLQGVLSTAQKVANLDEIWLTSVDKQCRKIVEDLKHHTLHYSRIEEALLALHSDKPKMITEDEVVARKTKYDVDMLKEEINRKSSMIENLMAEKNRFEAEVKELQTKIGQLELNYKIEKRSATFRSQLSNLQDVKSQLDLKILEMKHLGEDLTLEGERSRYEEALKDAESSYDQAVLRLKEAMESEKSSALLSLQEHHLHQLTLLQQTITEQAVKIGASQMSPDEIAEDKNVFLDDAEARKQLDLVMSGIEIIHKEELALVVLASKHASLNKPSSDLFLVHKKDFPPDSPSLLIQFRYFVINDFINKLKDLVKGWHSAYESKISDIERLIIKNISDLSDNESSSGKAEIIDKGLRDYSDTLNSALDFIENVDNEYKNLLNQIERSVVKCKDVSLRCFQEVKASFEPSSDLLQLKEQLDCVVKEKEELERRLTASLELVESKHEMVAEKMEMLIRAVRESCAETTEPPLAELRANLEEEHRNELDHLRAYYVQMCSNLEKQYTEDVNSLHSKLASLSSISPDHSNAEVFPHDSAPEPRSEEESQPNNWEKHHFSSEQIKYIEDLKSKWSEEMKDLKTQVERKYSLKMEEFRSILSSYLYKGELEMCARCLKDEVMRECEAEIASIEAELSEKMRSYQDKASVVSPLTAKRPQISFFCQISAQTSPCLPLSPVPDDLHEIYAKQELNSSILSKFIIRMDHTLTNLNNKLKEKEHKVIMLQNKFNNLSQFVLSIVNKNSVKEVSSDEEVELDFKEQYCKLIKERDSLKEMTDTLKSAVTQLVMYLNTCEDELNKTVVEELVKICQETPQKKDSPIPRRVHFAPEATPLDETSDLSTSLRLQLDSCLSKLKMEAASLLGLTALHPPPANLYKQIDNLRKENEDLIEEIALLKNEKFQKEPENEEVFCGNSGQFASSLLVEKVQLLLSKKESHSPETAKLLEELAKFGDKIISDLQKEKLDLQSQIEAADKQLKSTRQFLEEQAQERESERDEYNREVKNLLEQLKESSRLSNSQQLFMAQIQQMELQLQETKELLQETEKGKDAIEVELKEAIEKVWLLRGIISDLEAQLNRKSEKEELLERKLDELEAELDHHSYTHIAMTQELESLRGQSMEDSYLEQIKQLQENIKVQFDSSVVRHIKSQLHDMEVALERRTKELENVYLTYSNPSLSSPSEEISVQMEQRSKTPEESPSPVALPVQELARLQDKLARHATAEEVLIKRYRDVQLSSSKLAVQLEEMQAERDVIQHQMKKQMAQLAEANNKVDDLRHKVETAQASANKDLISELHELKQKYSLSEQMVESLKSEIEEQKLQLAYAEETIKKQRSELQAAADRNHEMIDTLRLQLASVTAEKNRLEDLSLKVKQESNFDVMNALLEDKNEDIEHLQLTVSLLQNKETSEKHVNSKGHKVSFASDVTNESTDISRLRDAPHHSSLILSDIPKVDPSIKSLNDSPLSMRSLSDISECSPEHEQFDIIQNLRDELKEKCDSIESLEKEVSYMKNVQEDLKKTKSELETVLTTIKEDKDYYEKHMKKLNDEITTKNNEIDSLKQKIIDKDQEIIKMTDNVKVLEEISLKLQEKVEQAKKMVEEDNFLQIDSLLKEKEKEIALLNEEINACKSDLTDEKELVDTLRSSVNVLTREKVHLEEKITLIQIENGNLSNALLIAEKKLDQFITSIKNLKNSLVSRYFGNLSSDSSSHSSPSSKSSGENELSKLNNEISKLISVNDQLNAERSVLMDEIREIKSAVFSEQTLNNDTTIRQLQDDLVKLRTAVIGLKEEKLKVFSNFSSEVDTLKKEIISLNKSREAVSERLHQALSEKKEILNNFSKLQEESERIKIVFNRFKNRKNNFGFADISIIDIPPANNISSLDILTEQMRNEIKVSKSLDNALLGTIGLNDTKLSGDSDYQRRSDFCPEVFERALLEEVKRSEEVKKKLNEKVEACQLLQVENSMLKIDIDRLQRLLSNQKDKTEQLQRQVEAQKEKVVSLELAVMREQSNLKQATLQLEEERSQGRKTQQEDISLIETLRHRLQNTMENEIKLKKLVLEERAKAEQLLAQFNSLKAFDRYRSESSDINSKHVKEMIEEEKNKFLLLEVEYAKEKKTCEDLRNVLTRERTALTLLKDNLLKSERLQQEKEREIYLLKKNLDEEIMRRKNIEIKLKTVENSTTRNRVHLQTEEVSKNKELDKAHLLVGELEREYSLLMRKQNELKDELGVKNEECKRLRSSYGDLRKMASDLVEERRHLVQTVESLRQERSGLNQVVNSLSQERVGLVEAVRDLKQEQGSLKVSEVRLRQLPQIEALVRNLMMSEKHRKALVYQKQYLASSLRHYQASCLRLVPKPLRRVRFRSTVLTVIAAIRLSKLPIGRLRCYNSKKEIVLEEIKKSLPVIRSTSSAHSSKEGPY